MNQDRLFRDFPISVRCETSNTIAFVACPVGGRYGDVRKTLAGLLQVDFSTLGIGPAKLLYGGEAELFNDDEVVRDENGEIIIHARVFKRNQDHKWDLL